MTLLSRRGCYPVNFLKYSPDDYKDWQSGNTPCAGQDTYLVLDVLKTLENMNRYNFIELLFGLPKKEQEYQGKYLF